ncbi:MAG: hypothetical protein IPJ71_19245 [Bdellovibrionales bacterium]|nr:hypothetical protein [Bdellovibrionales bacterium]
MKAVTYVVIILSSLSTPAFAGSVLDDLFNLATLGKYNQSYEEAKARTLRDLAHEQNVLQSKLNDVSAERDLYQLKVLGIQYDLANINYEKAKTFSNSLIAIVKMIENINLSHLRSNNDINLSLEVASDLQESYKYMMEIKNVKFDSKYIENVQKVWWDSFSKIAEIAKENQKSPDELFIEALMNLDEKSIESLYRLLIEFQNNVTSKMVSDYRERMRLLARKYNGQLKIVKTFGKGLELKEIELIEGDK